MSSNTRRAISATTMRGTAPHRFNADADGTRRARSPQQCGFLPRTGSPQKDSSAVGRRPDTRSIPGRSTAHTRLILERDGETRYVQKTVDPASGDVTLSMAGEHSHPSQMRAALGALHGDLADRFGRPPAGDDPPARCRLLLYRRAPCTRLVPTRSIDGKPHSTGTSATCSARLANGNPGRITVQGRRGG